MPRIYILAGCAGSGKSTFRSKMIETSPDLVELSSDDFIEAQARSDGKTYQGVYMQYRDAAKADLLEKLGEATAAERDIVWDQTNLTAKTRRACLELIPDSYTFVGIGFEAPLSLTLERVYERALATGKELPDEVVRAQHAGYERPHFDEGFDHVMVVHAPSERIEVVS